jgi:hypothetical protein
MIVERRQVLVAAAPEGVSRIVTRLGGERGWLTHNWAWRLRGITDRLAGGLGLRRKRRDPKDVRPGDAIDFWRVEAVVPGRLLRLRAEMKVPGRAGLQSKTDALDGGTLLVQSAHFAPRGLFGLLYRYGLYPLHALIFSGLIGAIRRRPESTLGMHVHDGQNSAAIPQGGDSRDR